MNVFNRTHLRRMRERCAPLLPTHGFLMEWAGQQLLSRLSDFTRSFDTIVQLGARAPRIVPNALTVDLSPALAPDIVSDEEALPFKPESLDLILSPLSLHGVNDLPGALIQIRRALNPDGLFLAAMLGGETLFELRQALAHAELAVRGGVSPRVFPFADKQQMGALLQRAGFALPVVDSELVRVTYPDLKKLMQDLRGMGETNVIAARHGGFTPRALFSIAEEYYRAHFADPEGRLEATFEIIFLAGWAPHAGQQKPLKPGSAQARLSDHLGTTEIKTGESAAP